MPIELTTAIVAGIFVIIGGVISSASSWWVDKQRHKRELGRRWDNDIRQYSVDIVSQVDSYLRDATLHEHMKLIVSPVDDDSAITKRQQEMVDNLDSAVRQTFQSMSRSLELLSFVAPASVTSAARSLVVTVTTAGQDLVGDSARTRERIENKRSAFIAEIRKALGVPPLG